MSLLHGPYQRHFRRAIGLCLTIATVLLWTLSNFLASTIFANDIYSKPYFVTYINTASFTFLLPVTAVIKRVFPTHGSRRNGRPPSCSPESLPTNSTSVRESSTLLGQNDNGDPSPLHRNRKYIINLVRKYLQSNRFVSTLWADRELESIAKVGFTFCVLWFAANYTLAAGLQFTTVSSSTILTSTSGLWTLVFGSIYRVESFNLKKLLGVIASLGGIIIISTSDISGESDHHRGYFPHKSLFEMAAGNALSLGSAVLYGIYTVYLKVRLGDDLDSGVPVLFGVTGALNTLLLWPGLVILHSTGWEPFEMPPNSWVWSIIVINSLSSLISDLCWAYATLLTSPLLVTIGLSLSIPLSLIGQLVLNSQSSSSSYWLGAGLVLSSFVLMNYESSRGNETSHSATGEGEEQDTS